MQATDCLSDAGMSAVRDVQERIMRQTLEALLFEGILDAQRQGRTWTFEGVGWDGRTVRYACEADAKLSFGRVRIEPGSIRREGARCDDLHSFLEETVRGRLDGAHTDAFVRELLETFAKDVQSRTRQPARIPEEDRHYEALESHMADGHPYHPSYKSRLGFSLADNLAYGPEFNPNVAVHWTAVSRALADVAVSASCAPDEWLRRHVTEEDAETFRRVIAEKGNPDTDYILIPVHPWQAERVLPSAFATQIAARELILLGPSSGVYRPQQSIRTLAHRGNPEAPYLKLALSIVNTSTSRILAHHTTQNAPLISDWLHGLIAQDPLLAKANFRILRETAGVSFRYDALPPLQYRLAYGTLGAICRENVSAHLEPGETAWPLNALSLVQKDGEPFLRRAIAKYGVERWSDALVRTLTLPIIHLLYAHGIALESHAQNIVLVTQDDFPKRIIVKDLHDGVRYKPELLARPELAPRLRPEPETHRKFNRYSFIHAGEASDVRDYTYDAFYFICMTDICFALERFGLPESSFWRKCAAAIDAYQAEHPELAERFALFDLFAEDARIEEMTKRRIYGDGELYFRKAANPLRIARESLR